MSEIFFFYYCWVVATSTSSAFSSLLPSDAANEEPLVDFLLMMDDWETVFSKGLFSPGDNSNSAAPPSSTL